MLKKKEMFLLLYEIFQNTKLFKVCDKIVAILIPLLIFSLCLVNTRKDLQCVILVL